MRYTERMNNTSEQVREYLVEALAVVDELDPPTDLRVACFERACDLVCGKQVIAESFAPAILGGGRPAGL